MSAGGAADRRMPVPRRRSWLFVPGADRDALMAAAQSGADVLCQELEDFTAPEQRPAARAMAPEVVAHWREAGAVAAVRINPLAGDGRADLEAAMAARPDAVYLPKVDGPDKIAELDHAIEALERRLGIKHGTTEIIPNVESARGLLRTFAIAQASARVTACLVASEDMAADLGAARSREGTELAYARARFHVDCVAAGVISIDCPYTWRDAGGLRAEARHAAALGYTAKSAVDPSHVPLINEAFTPQAEAIADARRIVDAFEAARRRGEGTAVLDGNLVELPTVLTAQRLLTRAKDFGLG